MSSSTAGDPFVTYKEAYDRMEALWTKPMQQMLVSESFMDMMSVTRESLLGQQKQSRETIEQFWDSLRIPTKADCAKLAGQIVSLDSKLDAFEERFDALESNLEAVLGKLENLDKSGEKKTAGEAGKRNKR